MSYVIKDDGTPIKTQRAFSTFYQLVRLFEGLAGAFLKAGNDSREGSFLPESVSFFQANAYLFSSVGKLSNDCENHAFILLATFNCLYDSLNLSNHCRSIFLRRSLSLIQDHLSHTKSPMVAQSSSSIRFKLVMVR